jgi:hypothetical protein
MADLQKLRDSILVGNAQGAVTVTREALAENVDPLQQAPGAAGQKRHPWRKPGEQLLATLDTGALPS